MKKRPTNLGPLPLVHGLVATLSFGMLAALLALWPVLAVWVVMNEGSLWGLFAGFEVVTFLSLGIALVTRARAARTQAGCTGRSRVQFAAIAHVVSLVLVHVPLLVLLYGAAEAVDSGFSFTFGIDEARLALTDRWRSVLEWSAGIWAVVALLDWGFRLSLWYLLPKAFRVGFWVLVDVSLLGAFIFVTAKLPIQPANDDLEALREPILRLGVTTLFGMRVFARLLPIIMSSIERFGALPLVAARHLRSKKSGFLAAIGGLSIGAVAVSTCMLVGVLSVMGGFRDDLQQKILGNHAHVLIDREHNATFEGWQRVLDAARDTEGAIAATPYVRGEVMLTSASNRAGAELRGIEPESFPDVTRIESYLEQGRGRIDYLVHPERLLDLPPEERRSILPMEIVGPDDDEDGADDEDEDPRPDSLIRDIDEELDSLLEDDLDEEPAIEALAEPPSNPVQEFLQPQIDDRGREVLPGIIVGKELARTLRVFLGDDVDVVSPMGDLGPAGPMPKARRFRVAGIFYSGMYEFDMKLVYVLLPRAQSFLNTGDAISGIEIKVDDVETAPEIATAVGARMNELGRDELRVRDWQETNERLFGALAVEKLAMFITLGIAILIAGFCVFGTLTLMVQEKGREVGILFAMGTTQRGIVSIFMLEGLLIGLYGASIGLGMGFVATFAFEHFGIRLNPEVYYIDRLPVHVDAMEFLVVGLVALGMCVLATIFPAVLASRAKPVEAIRYQ